MAAITTTLPAVGRRVWVQREGLEATYLPLEPHTEIIDDVKRIVFGIKRDEYRASHRGQGLRPDSSIPTDASYGEPIQFERIRNRRSIPFNDDDDDAGMGIRLEAIDKRRTRTMLNNHQKAARCHRHMQKLQSNCTSRRCPVLRRRRVYQLRLHQLGGEVESMRMQAATHATNKTQFAL